MGFKGDTEEQEIDNLHEESGLPPEDDGAQDEHEDDQEGSEHEEDDAEESEDDDEAEDEESDVRISFGDEDESSDDTEEDEGDGVPLPKKLRKVIKSKDKELRELKRKIKEHEQASKSENEPGELPEKPKLEDFDWDQEKFGDALIDWREKQSAHEQRIQAQKEQEQAQAEQWQQAEQRYVERKQALKIPDFDDVEEVVQETFEQHQIGAIVGGAKDSAALLYAIGKSPSKMRELASIKDPVKFIWAVAQLEKELKVEKNSTRKPSAKPEKRVKGAASPAAADKQLARLQADAEKSGDYSKVIAYKRSKKKS